MHLAIEFDTFWNSNIDDPDGNHMGISENGDPDSVLTAGIAEVLNDGSVYRAWADYDGATSEVHFASTASRPSSPGNSSTTFSPFQSPRVGSCLEAGFSQSPGLERGE